MTTLVTDSSPSASLPLTRAARIALPVVLAGVYATLGVAREVTNRLRDAGYLRTSVAIAFAMTGIAAAWLLLRDPRNRSPRVLASVAIAAAVYGAAVWPMESPEEKVHFITYGLVALLAWAAAPAAWSARKRLAGAAFFTAAAGWLDEGIQAILPNRYYDLRDVGFNAAAGLLALAALAAVRWARPPDAAELISPR